MLIVLLKLNEMLNEKLRNVSVFTLSDVIIDIMKLNFSFFSLLYFNI